MPNRDEHTRSCREKYGYGFSEVHEWMDEPVNLYGREHRKERHDKDVAPDKAEKVFWDKVPPEYRDFIRDAVLDHLNLDYKDKDYVEPTLRNLNEQPRTTLNEVLHVNPGSAIGVIISVIDAIIYLFFTVSGYVVGILVGLPKLITELPNLIVVILICLLMWFAFQSCAA